MHNLKQQYSNSECQRGRTLQKGICKRVASPCSYNSSCNTVVASCKKKDKSGDSLCKGNKSALLLHMN